MQKNNAPYSIRLILIIVGLSGVMLSNFSRNYSGNIYALSIIVFIIQLIVVDLMLRESDIYRTIYFRIINILIAIYIVGALFKILHYPGADLILLISISGFAVNYTARTATKKNINALDILKSIWLTIACASAIFNLFHWKYAYLLSWINMISFFVMAVLFFLSPPKKHSDKQTVNSDKPFDLM